MWLMDAIAMTDGTIGGVGKLLAETLPNLSTEELPEWAKDKTQKELATYMTKVVGEAYQTSVIVHEYVERERAKGRVINEIYDEIKPFLDERMKRFDVEEKEEAEYEDLFTPEKDEGEAGNDPSYVAAVMQAKRCAAPHKRLQEKSRDPRGVSDFEAVFRSMERRSITAAVRPHPRASEIREPLMLLGSINKWNLAEAREEFAFSFTGTRDPSFQESKIRITVPEEGLKFQILSRKQGPRWKILPATVDGELQDGNRSAVQVNVHFDKGAVQDNNKCFEITGSGQCGTADIWVAMNLETGVEVWFMDLA